MACLIISRQTSAKDSHQGSRPGETGAEVLDAFWLLQSAEKGSLQTSKLLSGLGSQEAVPVQRCHWSLWSALAPLQICGWKIASS